MFLRSSDTPAGELHKGPHVGDRTLHLSISENENPLKQDLDTEEKSRVVQLAAFLLC